MRVPIIAGNWKMHKTPSEATEFVRELRRKVSAVRDCEVVVGPSFVALSDVLSALDDSSVKVAAQNMYWEDKGAYTGETSGPMLKDMGVDYVIIGHSERRQFFNETDDTVNMKVKAALVHGLKAIICIGESLEERENNKTFVVVERQLRAALDGVDVKEMVNIVVAYEPIWAIGTGRTATVDQAQEVHRHLRKLMKMLYGFEVSDAVRIQYGGSVKPSNVKELMAQEDIDGALVGGASLDVNSFVGIVKFKE